MKTSRDKTIRVALVGGPMYDPLYESLPAFERETGFRVEVVAQLPHPELNAYVKDAFDAGAADLDMLSTHTKYAPSQAHWLAPLDTIVSSEVVDDLLPRAAELSRIDGRLLQVPRNLDVRLLHVRRDLLQRSSHREAFEQAFGRPLRVPDTWDELAEIAELLTQPSFYGFLFPGRDSGLFGTFYELLVTAGGELFDDALRPAFDSSAGEWAASYLADLHQIRRVTPRELTDWHYDEISAAFRAGHAAMVCDWPGSYHLYTDASTCEVSEHVELARLPLGPAGLRAAYAGCHSFAIPLHARNRKGGESLLHFLISFDQQLGEARRGAIPCRASALRYVREEAAVDSSAARRWDLLAETEQVMIIPPRFAAYPACEDAIWRAIQLVIEGSLSPSAAVARAATEIKSIVDAQTVAR